MLVKNLDEFSFLKQPQDLVFPEIKLSLATVT
jgi:hypothetical protein